MTDINRLYRALEAADAAGDTDAAQRLAEHIRSVQSTPAAPPAPIPEPSLEVPMWTDEDTGKTLVASSVPPAPKGEDVLMGTEDPAYGIMQLAGRITGNPIDDEISLRERVYQKGRGPDAGMDWGRLGGNVAVTAPLGAVLPATLPAAIGSGAVLGATQPVTDGGENFWQDKAAQAGIGAGGGLLGHGITKGVGKALFPGQQQVDLARSKVRLTPGQALGGVAKQTEQKLTSVPLLGNLIERAQGVSIKDFNKSVYNYALEPLGKKFTGQEVGRKGVRAVKETIDDRYDEILRRVDLTVDNKLIDDITEIMVEAPKRLGSKRANEFNRTLDDILFDRLDGSGMLNGRQLKEVQSSLRSQASQLSKGTGDKQRLGRAYAAADKALRSALDRQHPKYKEALDAADIAYSRYMPMEEAAGLQGAQNGVFSPNQYTGRVRMSRGGANKRRFARGEAYGQDLAESARDVIGDVYPDSGTAGRIAAGTALGGAAYVEPATLAAVAAASAPYLPGVSTGVGRALALRPQALEPVGRAAAAASPLGALLGAQTSSNLGR